MRPAAALAAAALLLVPPAFAQPPSLLLEDLTWPELRDAVAGGKTTVLVPIGGTEQNGPHMVLGKHNARAAALSLRIAEGLGDALVAPVIAYVPEGTIEPPAGHMKFPGTISIPEDAFEKTLEGAARSLRHAGFRDIVLLGDHGGYAKSLSRVAARLNGQWGAAAHVHALREYYRELPHAGKDDTSLALAIRGGVLVRPDRIDARAVGQGAAEDPAGAGEKAGVALAQQVVDRTVAAIKKAIARR